MNPKAVSCFCYSCFCFSKLVEETSNDPLSHRARTVLLHLLCFLPSLFLFQNKFKPAATERIKEYIVSLHAKIEELGGSLDVDDGCNNGKPTEEETPAIADVGDDGFTVPQYESGSGEDYEKQSELKAKATDSKNSGNYEEALESYNEAVVAAPPSALLYANRAIVLEKLGHYKAAETDCKLALEQNPDSAKALKTRGKLRYQHLDDWEGALRYVHGG